MSILGKRGIKKTAVILCTTAMLVTFGGCGNTDSGETPGSASESADAQKDYSNQTVIGQVKAIGGTKVTLQLGKMDFPSMKEKPESDDENGKQPGDGQGDFEKSEGDGQNDAEKPERTEGDIPDDAERPEMSQLPPDGEKENREKNPPSGTDGDIVRKGNGGFTAGEETLSLDLDGVSIVTNNRGESTETKLEDIAEGDILTITLGENNTVKSVEVRSGKGFGNPTAEEGTDNL